ncbi:hypothetical protein [Taibaiella helva]|uniref:hypothetical protein n=1 Tax=Taibaiella helva TaxID=2301235 RepID=UPI0013005799|nr:hypothetical protein [Taibaiella helva]
MKRRITLKLNLKKESLHILSANDINQIKAGEEVADTPSVTKPRTYICATPVTHHN